MGQFDDDIVLITGGTKGIGFATAEQFVDQDATVIINYHSDDQAAEKAIAKLKKHGGSADVKKFDISDSSAVKQSVDEIFNKYGEISILINNAANINNKLAVQMSDQQWDDVIKTNLYGTFYCSREIGRKMAFGKIEGNIVNISSIAGVYGFSGQSNYGASKAGINNLTKIMSQELGTRNIRVNAVVPGLADTQTYRDLKESATADVLESIPLGRPANPEEIANVILFVASKKASYMNGSIVRVDGGSQP